MTTLIGDLHGDKTFVTSQSFFEPYSIQLGDLDLYGYDWADFSLPRYFVDGNHDQFPKLDIDATEPYEVKGNLWYIPRGWHQNGILYIGGGDSIDKHLRQEGVSWFREECLTIHQMNRIMDIKEEIHTIISHDCPAFIYPEMMGINLNSIVGNHCFDLNHVFNKFKPNKWFFGHHHKSKIQSIDNCIFKCLNIDEKHQVNLPKINI